MKLILYFEKTLDIILRTSNIKRGEQRDASQHIHTYMYIYILYM